MGKLIIGVVGSQPSSHRQRKIMMPAQNGQAVGDSNLKQETVSTWMAFYWLSRVRKI